MKGQLGSNARRRQRHRHAVTMATGLVAGLLLVASGLLWLSSPATNRLEREASIGGPFRLVSGDGSIVTEASFPGKYKLIYFGYTTCRDVCPTTLNGVVAALDRLGEKAARVQPLFITIDPARDTEAVLQRYTSGFSPRLIGLTGAPGELRKVADAYRVSIVAHREAGDGSGYAFDHSSVLYLMAPGGQFVAPIAADATDAAMALAIARAVP